MDAATFFCEIDNFERLRSPANSNLSRRDRTRIGPAERRILDLAVAKRLDGLGADPWTAKVTNMVDLQTLEEFHDLTPLREHWIFSRPSKQRAAAFNTVFSAYAAQTNASGFRGYVLRPAPAKAKLGALASVLKEAAQTYGRVMANAKRDGLARPVALFVHPRWDETLEAWDVHLHTIVDVIPGMEDKTFLRLAMNFSTPQDIGVIQNVSAWANYCSSWIIDHRDIENWPDEAVMEFWSLKSPQFIRKAGNLAEYARRVRGKELRWEMGSVVVTEKESSELRQRQVLHPLRDPAQMGYARVRIGGRKRSCAIFRYERPKKRITADRSLPVHLDLQAAGSPRESTTITGSIPSRTFPKKSENFRIPHRIRYRLSVWSKIWPYGSSVSYPRPILRRLADKGIITIPKLPVRPSRRQDQP